MRQRKTTRTDGEKNNRWHGRLRFVAACGLLGWAVLAGRLVQVQGVQHAQYAERAREQHEREVALQARRGRILDRQGRELAMDVGAVSFYADPAVVSDADAVARHFAPLGQYAVGDLKKALKGPKRFVYLARQLGDKVLEKARDKRFKGVFELAEVQRYYPYGRLAGQALGFTDLDNSGREGIEAAFNAQLQPQTGSALQYIDARGNKVHGREEERQQPRNGNDLVLTIDATYQNILEEELVRAMRGSGAESGMGVIADPQTGEILAMASVPLYEPGAPGRVHAALRRNRPVTDAFEPGSTFKAFTASAVFEEGRLTAEDMIFCEEGRFQLDNGDIIRDISPNGWLSFRQVIEKSSNIGVIKAAQQLPRQHFYRQMRSFGFGLRAGSGLPAESGGVLRHPRDWSDRSLATMAIGQEVSVTVLQMIQAFGAIANGGTLLAPRIVQRIVGPDGEVVEERGVMPVRRVISEATAAKVRRLLTGVVANGTGSRAAIDGIDIAGKTGTAQRASADGKGYIPGENVVSFIGFLPAAKPDFLCMVVIDNPQRDKWGGHIAAPAFKRIAERVLYHNGRLPSAAAERLEGGGLALAEVPVPDLRGMAPRVARYQAGVRGLRVVFSGDGELIVDQDPPPGKTGQGNILCRLGRSQEVYLPKAGAMPQRQSLLLEKLAHDKLAAWN